MTLLAGGSVPGWAEAAKPRFPMINARAETVLERPAYRDLVAKAEHRCLVLADGWYEWQEPEDPQQPRRPVHFSLPDGAPFCFAGLWTGSSFELHDRHLRGERPRAADPRSHAGGARGARRVGGMARPRARRRRTSSELLEPLPSRELAVRPANPVVNSVRNDGPDCLEPELTLL